MREEKEKLQECISVSAFAGNISRYPSEQGLPYLANVPPRSHLVLFRENENAARFVEFWYILHGLVKGEHCIYTTHGDTDKHQKHDDTERVSTLTIMKRRGGLLHILKIDDPMDHPRGPDKWSGQGC